MATTSNLIQILLPANGGDEGVFERLAQELTAKFGGVTSFIRAPAEGLWNAGSHIERDDIVVIEVMVESTLAPLLPAMPLASALPVPSIASVPVRVWFSTLAPQDGVKLAFASNSPRSPAGHVREPMPGCCR
jgi:hypothetical protein